MTKKSWLLPLAMSCFALFLTLFLYFEGSYQIRKIEEEKEQFQKEQEILEEDEIADNCCDRKPSYYEIVRDRREQEAIDRALERESLKHGRYRTYYRRQECRECPEDYPPHEADF